jgi:hypothetical protein
MNPLESEPLALDAPDWILQERRVSRWPRASIEPAEKTALTGSGSGVNRVAGQRKSAVYPDVRIDIAVAQVRKCPNFSGAFSAPACGKYA